MKASAFSARRIAMVKEQIEGRGIQNQRVLAAMRVLPRHDFVPQKFASHAYEDRPLPIGKDQTISQPYMVAAMTSWLQVEPEDKVLEIGTGSGYQSAVLSFLADQIISLERIPSLANKARKNLAALGIKNVKIHVADGSLGWPSQMPYDAILVAAAAPDVPPALLEQLADGGRLVIPVGPQGRQRLDRWVRNKNSFQQEKGTPVAFVPLIGSQAWSE